MQKIIIAILSLISFSLNAQTHDEYGVYKDTFGIIVSVIPFEGQTILFINGRTETVTFNTQSHNWENENYIFSPNSGALLNRTLKQVSNFTSFPSFSGRYKNEEVVVCRGLFWKNSLPTIVNPDGSFMENGRIVYILPI